MMRRTTALLFVLLIATVCRAATPDEVNAAIRNGVDYLYKQQNKSGNWEHTQEAPGPGTSPGDPDGGQWGGRTALATYALLAAGERPLDDRVVKAVEWLRTAKITGNYALGMRANVWFYLPTTKPNTEAMEADARRLRAGGSSVGTGLFDYQPGGMRTDLSCSQYGVLGCWAAAQRTNVFDLPFWTQTEANWCEQQNEDGGWSYNGHGGGSSLQITAAGVASLFITQDFAHPSDAPVTAKSSDKYFAPASIDRGVAWITQNLPEHLKNPMLYALYGIERAGVASGYKYFGDLDWYKNCADAVVKLQQPDGSFASRSGFGFSPEIDTSFALLFLSRGRAPVMVNKLDFDIVAKRTATTRPADWNLHPRDVANVTRWVEARTERRLNWQVLKLSAAPVDDLHDAPVLYLTGRLPVSLSDDDAAKLKQYVEEGGLIVANADANNSFFSRTVRTLGESLFPGRKFAPVDPKHVLMSGEEFPLAAQKRPVTVEGIGNGARLFMLLVTNGDLSAVYQRQDERRLSAYQFMANAYLYSVEKTETRFKGQTHVVRPNPATQPSRAFTVARLLYDGRPDPEPGGWRRLAAVLHNDADIELTVKPVRIGRDSLAGVSVAHLTGVDAVHFDDDQLKAIREYLDAGGLLLIDACGGSPAFDTAMESELARIDPEFAQQLPTPMSPDHPLFTAADGKPIVPGYRPFGRPQLGPLVKAFQLRGLSRKGKLAVIYSPYDLSVGLVGQPIDGIVGYTPDVATALVRRLIELKLAKKI